MDRRLLMLGIVVLLVSACSDATTGIRGTDGNPMLPGNALLGGESGLTLEVHTDAIEPGASARLVLTNESTDDAGYNLCFHVLERRDEGRWGESGIDQPRACILVLHILEPGESAHYETTLPDPLPSGIYRFRAAVHLLDVQEFRDQVTPPFVAE